MYRLTFSILALLACEMLSGIAAAQPPGRDPGPPRRWNPLLRLFDADQDGALSAEEIAAVAGKLREFDQSGDGVLSAEELGAALPFGGGPGPGARGGRGGQPPFRPGGGRGGAPAVTEAHLERPPLAKDDQEKQILQTLEAMRQGPRFANVSPTDGRLLRMLAEAIHAQRVVEIGTSTGESAVWLALGLRRNGGHLFTHEIDEQRAAIARENFQKAGVDSLITVVLGDAHETIRQYQEPIDMVFLDADKEGYIDYLEKLLPLVRPGGLVVAHNINTAQADLRFVKAITENPTLETLVLLKEGTGVSVTLKKR